MDRPSFLWNRMGNAYCIWFLSPQSFSIPDRRNTHFAILLLQSMGFAIFPLVFGYGLEVNSGAGLFETLPLAFGQMPAKSIGALFSFY